MRAALTDHLNTMNKVLCNLIVCYQVIDRNCVDTLARDHFYEVPLHWWGKKVFCTSELFEI